MNEKIEIGKYYLDKNGSYGDKRNKNGETEGVLIYCFGEASFEETGDMVSPADDLDYPLEKLKNFIGVLVQSQITIGEKTGMRLITAYKDSEQAVLSDNSPHPHQWIPIDPPKDIIDRFQKTSCFMGLDKMFLDHMVETYKPLYENEIVRAKEIYKKAEIVNL